MGCKEHDPQLGSAVQDRRVDWEAVYARLPISTQHLACSLVGLHTERTRYRGDFPRLLEEAQERTYWSIEEIEAFRNRRLARFVAHCVATVPFYRERLRLAQATPGDIKSLGDLAQLPILEKEDAQEHAAELKSTAVRASDTHTAHTSGTTGRALRFRVTVRASREQWAIWWRFRCWHGIERGTWCALFAGRSVVPIRQQRPPFWRINYPGRQLIFSGYHINHDNLSEYLAALRRRRPQWLHGYPSLLALVAAYVVETGSDLGYQVRWVTTGAENLLPHQSDVIERAFGVKPLQHYGLAEGTANVSQCELGTLHVDEDYAAVEFVALGQEGLHRIIGTNFTNLATPLLRYDSQDLATIRADASCSCGRPGRVLERIDGRLEDYVVLRNGTRVGRLDHIFKDLVNIQEAQIYQARPGQITIRVVRGRDYGEADERMLLRETKKRVGDDMEVGIEYVENLSRSSLGKLRFVVSEIPEASIGRPSLRPPSDVLEGESKA
jgi:phenylacetate-CoA ligase